MSDVVMDRWKDPIKESSSREESLEFLKELGSVLTPKEYRTAYSAICSFSIEGMFASYGDVLDLIVTTVKLRGEQQSK